MQKLSDSLNFINLSRYEHRVRSKGRCPIILFALVKARVGAKMDKFSKEEDEAEEEGE